MSSVPTARSPVRTASPDAKPSRRAGSWAPLLLSALSLLAACGGGGGGGDPGGGGIGNGQNDATLAECAISTGTLVPAF